MSDYNFDEFLKPENTENKKKLLDADSPEELKKKIEEKKDPFTPPFKYIDDRNRPEDTRPNHKIVKCCNNCKYFQLGGSTQTSRLRGFCKQPNPETKNLSKIKLKEDRYRIINREWLRTYTTMVCDLHEFQSYGYSVEFPSKWVNKPLRGDKVPHEDW